MGNLTTTPWLFNAYPRRNTSYTILELSSHKPRIGKQLLPNNTLSPPQGPVLGCRLHAEGCEKYWATLRGPMRHRNIPDKQSERKPLPLFGIDRLLAYRHSLHPVIIVYTTVLILLNYQHLDCVHRLARSCTPRSLEDVQT